MGITAELASKHTVVKALEHAIADGQMESILTFWNISMSPEEHKEFGDSFALFESCVRRRYNLMTGGTL